MDIDEAYSTENYKNLLYEIEDIVDLKMNIENIEKSIENIRNISEFLIYGCSKNKTYFEIFEERNILYTFDNILDIGNEMINMQLIQTTSILIQNLNQEQDLFYFFSHPFLNKLISYNFDLSGNTETVDYFISFLKMLSLKIDKNTIQFFYNQKYKNFPLYRTAINLYNHPETLVRTAARTITLKIYSLQTPSILSSILSLPHIIYFPHLSCHLFDLWL